MDASTVQNDIEAVVPYSMHVSSRYLDLTRQKLELTRLPRECEEREGEQWTLGTPKSVLEPLLDYWLETYDWRAEEAHFNSSLPQFRTTLAVPSQPPLRIHFVHRRSLNPNAIPLLFCHSWPSSFIEVQRIIDTLAEPNSADEQAFHVVVPSIPGFGFSDASVDADFGVWGTAEVFSELMLRLGYEGFVTFGSDWGFDICRALAMKYPQRCRAVHTTNPVFDEPSIVQSLLAWTKWKIARMTQAKLPALSFGYTSSDVAFLRPNVHSLRPLGPTLHRLYSLRPQTLAFSLCDSPMGLLAGLLDMIHSRGLDRPSVAPRSLSPFLSPGEMNMKDPSYNGVGHERVRSDKTVIPEKSEQSGAWSAPDILNWTMMMWLPGAEAGLRWLRCAHVETTRHLWNVYCPVPLGITSFRRHSDTGASTPPMWGSTWWPIAWVKRHQEVAEIAAWEKPDLLVLDLRQYFGDLLQKGMRAKFPLAVA